MSRSKRSGADDLVDLLAMLPWWVGVLLAVVLYFVLHWFAGQPVVSAGRPGHLGAMVAQSAWRAFAAIGQYILPLICLAGAGISAWRRHERKALAQSVIQSKSADALNGMSWQQFEELVGEAFRLQGYSVAETGGGGADGGVDLVLSRGGEKFLVQCKQWKAFKVPVGVVRELYGVMAAKGAAGGYVVTSGRFTDDAASFAAGRNVTLIDGPKLHELIQLAQTARHGDTDPSTSPTVKPRPAPPPDAPSDPTCPLCSGPMVRRMARRGANAGGEYWGCTAYPTCMGTRAIMQDEPTLQL
jgi:restriction system protein